MKILGIDPGSSLMGYGLIETTPNRNQKEYRVISYGCLKTKTGDKDGEKLKSLHEQLKKLIKKHSPDAVAVEEIFFFKNQKTIIQVSQARGVILLAAQEQKIKIYEYTPLQIKQALTGYGRAEKKQIQQMTKLILGLKEIPRPDDAADALAISICCAHSCKIENTIAP